jgi:hypothetical protein
MYPHVCFRSPLLYKIASEGRDSSAVSLEVTNVSGTGCGGGSAGWGRGGGGGSLEGQGD